MSDSKSLGFEELFMTRPESIEQLIDEMNSDVYGSLRLAVELGKWGDGARLNARQIDFCMQAIILYEVKHLPEQVGAFFFFIGALSAISAMAISIVTNANEQ